LLSADYRDFAAVEADNRARLSHDDGDLDGYAFVDYHRPVVELRQLESKASAAGIELDTDSRYYSRMRAARRPDAKYIRNERIPDEAYRLDRDPGEAENLADRDGIEDGDAAALDGAEAALATFEAEVGGGWGEVTDEDVLDEMGDEARDRLRDLGYVE
jgi:hypothetical protein